MYVLRLLQHSVFDRLQYAQIEREDVLGGEGKREAKRVREGVREGEREGEREREGLGIFYHHCLRMYKQKSSNARCFPTVMFMQAHGRVKQTRDYKFTGGYY